MVREVVNIHIGQAGIQMANAAWEIFCLEHGVSRNGTISNEISSDEEYVARQTFFEETESNLHVPRAVFIDTEPTVIDEIKTGSYRQLFNKRRLLNHVEDAGSNYARGRNLLARLMRAKIEEEIRKTTEMVDNLQGFFFTHGHGGGTGAGLTAAIFEQFSDFFGKFTKVQLAIYPSTQLSTGVVEPYNSVLNATAVHKYSDLCLLVDNEAMYNICTGMLDVPSPSYSNVNRLIAQMYSSLTFPVRFSGTINMDFRQLQTNLIPYPSLHYPMMRLAPLISRAKSPHETLDCSVITRAVFKRTSQTVMCDTNRGKFMAIALNYRGDVSMNEISDVIDNIRQCAADVRLVDWCPTGFKVGHCYMPPIQPPKSDMAVARQSVNMIANTTAMHEVFGRLNQKFDLLYTKKAFLFWYVSEGMEEGEFRDALEDMAEIQQDYFEAGKSLGKADDGRRYNLNDNNDVSMGSSVCNTPMNMAY